MLAGDLALSLIAAVRTLSSWVMRRLRDPRGEIGSS
jgi:hypothetical protein